GDVRVAPGAREVEARPGARLTGRQRLQPRRLLQSPQQVLLAVCERRGRQAPAGNRQQTRRKLERPRELAARLGEGVLDRRVLIAGALGLHARHVRIEARVLARGTTLLDGLRGVLEEPRRLRFQLESALQRDDLVEALRDLGALLPTKVFDL